MANFYFGTTKAMYGARFIFFVILLILLKGRASNPRGKKNNEVISALVSLSHFQ